MPSEAGDDQVDRGESASGGNEIERDSSHIGSTVAKGSSSDLHFSNGASDSETTEGDHMRRPSRADEPFEKWEREEMEALLHKLRGHLGKENALVELLF